MPTVFLSWLSLAPSLCSPLPPTLPIHRPPSSAWLEEVSGLCLDLDNSCLG